MRTSGSRQRIQEACAKGWWGTTQLFFPTPRSTSPSVLVASSTIDAIANHISRAWKLGNRLTINASGSRQRIQEAHAKGWWGTKQLFFPTPRSVFSLCSGSTAMPGDPGNRGRLRRYPAARLNDCFPVLGPFGRPCQYLCKIAAEELLRTCKSSRRIATMAFASCGDIAGLARHHPFLLVRIGPSVGKRGL